MKVINKQLEEYKITAQIIRSHINRTLSHELWLFDVRQFNMTKAYKVDGILKNLTSLFWFYNEKVKARNRKACKNPNAIVEIHVQHRVWKYLPLNTKAINYSNLK